MGLGTYSGRSFRWQGRWLGVDLDDSRAHSPHAGSNCSLRVPIFLCGPLPCRRLALIRRLDTDLCTWSCGGRLYFMLNHRRLSPPRTDEHCRMTTVFSLDPNAEGSSLLYAYAAKRNFRSFLATSWLLYVYPLSRLGLMTHAPHPSIRVSRLHCPRVGFGHHCLLRPLGRSLPPLFLGTGGRKL
ncbi:hypothetical protein FA13DRAFT_1735684 [Coprinellus micaceus]|uniref:Uncharacterized protein n=1 Tax=Coprinellus micaceus TaxID=71717 RepID=A0A4Y7T285_COPMI|nr:hypothetical protein FA13DRAFT_1735684 [Coprinellus micaceus]